MGKTILKGSFYLLSLFGVCSISFAQSNDADRFIMTSGSLPAIFSLDVIEEAKSLAQKQDILEEKLALKMYEEANYQLLELLNSGQIYVNDEMTDFLEKMLAEMLVFMPELKNDIRIIATRNTEANAFCMANGVIIVNVGLIAKLENSSQLASVLAHEICHYKKQHALRKKKNGKDLGNNEAISRKAGMYKMLQYSREFEFEADAAGLTFLTRTPFDAREASKSLALVESAINNDTLVNNLSFFFNSDIFTVDTAFFNRKMLKSELKKSVKKNRSIISGNDDSGETHPDIEKRVLAITEILGSLNYIPATPKLESEYQSIHHKAQFELSINSYNGSEYLNSLHEGLILLEKEPNNLLANEMVVKNLYWLCRLKENGVLDDYFSKAEINGNVSKARLKLFFSKTKSTDLGKMLYTYSKKKYEKFPDDQDLLFYLGAAAEMHLGKDAAEIHYRNYSTKFPDGIYSGYVAQKIK